MADFRDFIYRISNSVEHKFDTLKLDFRKRMGWETNVHICPYNSFGTREVLYVKGRVLHDRGIQTTDRDEFWDNLVNMYKRFNSHEIKGAQLRVSFQGIEKEIFTDEDGYFGDTLKLNPGVVIPDLWCYPKLELISSPIPFDHPVKADAGVMVPGAKSRFGIISDIDDTILKTNAVNIARMVYHTFTNNAQTRLAFPGVASFYRALQDGGTGDEKNPIFYVSSSPWNLYDLLIDFMKINGIPSGPVFLKDYGFTHNKIFTESHSEHKPKKIRKVINAYPQMQFILIGDSGQEDPEIYSEIINEFPDRILAVYIRDVTSSSRDSEIKITYKDQKIPFVYAENSYNAALHAAENGFIRAEFLSEILKGKEKDESLEE